MNSIGYAVSMLTSMIILGTSCGLQSERRWERPCGGQPVLSQAMSWIVPSVVPDTVYLNNLLSNLDFAILTTTSLKAKYRRRIQNHHLMIILDNTAYEYMPNITSCEDSVENVIQTYLEMYEILSHIAVMVEQVLHDERIATVNSFVPQLEAEQSNIYSALCNLKNLVINNGRSITNFVSPSILPTSQRENLTEAKRNQRDYLIAKDTGNLYSAMIRTTEFIKTQENNEVTA